MEECFIIVVVFGLLKCDRKEGKGRRKNEEERRLMKVGEEREYNE